MQTSLQFYGKCFLCMFLMFFVVFIASSYAATDKVTETLCLVVNKISGPIGKVIAILIIVVTAISLFLGKITWGTAITITVGMGLMFGAGEIVNLVAGTDQSEDPCKTIPSE